MSSKGCERIKRLLCDELSQRRLSISHDRWHLERVLAFAEQLQTIYGGDMEVLTAAVLLHDLGRSEPNLHGRDSVIESLKDAGEILGALDIPPSKIEAILRAIDEHDDPNRRPSAIEGRILKEADFLAGFGAWGILRIAMWAAETERGVDQVFDRLEKRMPKRIDGLEFSESARLASRETPFVDLFLSRLKEPALLEEPLGRGKYIVLEGISGSGKDTQADLLKPRLEQDGHHVLRVKEPAGKYQMARDGWGPRGADPVIQMFLLLADRYELMSEKVKPALARDDIVLSVRSFLSTMVHQHQSMYDSSMIAFMHGFVPLPDMVILYDLDVELAWQRCLRRAKSTMSEMGAYETEDTLRKHRQLYLDRLAAMPSLQIEVIDASRSISDVFDSTWSVVDRLLAGPVGGETAADL